MARGAKRPSARRADKGRSSASTSLGSKAKDDNSKSATRVPIEVQQKCLDFFRNAFNPTVGDNATLQEVKGHLYNRDFATAFGKDEYLQVYASRWSPSRALAYAQIFGDIEPYFALNEDVVKHDLLRVVSIGGGGGGELVGLSGWLAWLSLRPAETALQHPRGLRVDLVDIADWSQVTHALYQGVTMPPVLSEYASEAKKHANISFLQPATFVANFHRLDVLDTDRGLANSLMESVERTTIVTFMFTLNELYSTSMPKTQNLLTELTDTMNTGSLLLVVDSPGSYSTISINGTEKKYPMQWLLDYTLLGPPNPTDDTPVTVDWEKLINDSSRWFRLPKGLQYPIELEDMRYQIHLYRRV